MSPTASPPPPSPPPFLGQAARSVCPVSCRSPTWGGGGRGKEPFDTFPATPGASDSCSAAAAESLATPLPPHSGVGPPATARA